MAKQRRTWFRMRCMLAAYMFAAAAVDAERLLQVFK